MHRYTNQDEQPMRFPPNFLDDIRNRLRPSEVIGKSVALRNNGHEFSGLCPFHKEKTPSFTVSDVKGFYHCFGCGAHGDIIKFVMETSGLSFYETVENLAGQAGLSMPKMTEEEVKKAANSASLYEVMEMACCWFSAQLQDKDAEEAMKYLVKRAVSSPQMAKFRLGFAPDKRFALKQYMQSKGVSEKMLLDAGLVIKNDRGEIYDRFRGRVIFPIIDIKNRVIAFGGRILGDGQPKYLNSPETALFKKGDILYNENNARKPAFKSDRLVVAEGYMDVIALEGAGIKVAVAPLGTALTVQHVKRLWNITKEPVICLDGDAAGQRAMERAANICLAELQPGYTLKFARLPEGLDPDDLIKKNGKEQMKKVLQSAKPLSETLWNIELARNDIKTPEKKADLEKRLDDIVAKITNTNVAGHYKNYFKEKLWQINRGSFSKKNSESKLTEIDMIASDVTVLQQYEEIMLALIISHPELLDHAEVHDILENIEFSSNKLDKLYQSILEACHLKESVSKKDIILHLENSGLDFHINGLEPGNLFIGKNCTIEDALIRWKYNLSLYNLLTLKEECQIVEMEMTEISEQRVSEFKKQISILENEISMMEMSFGDQ